ncbi:ATP-binding cassette, subfamily C, exporter for protease/lipase/ATP-binding cassette, subfamily C, EexD [Ectothiorhodospira magna]|uniref:ATP-binding cassette, subfamily C, exporter for protease/lipase/ATP-binding cassette, subfamily C, EexD n=1 Tax=Ectothiorhodospira magna TaxID=867345 RepID=A0A1H9BKV5_9GAMM|nr:type I secretion system permease/ATPase [Ectothiorhodospira magna]SEP89387.1 ATP-binding cassette, subfamily C, exporter for protease/lipase/ATP-binding cassette, subfamily C, EexD [Ectothiorhodospira magna]
MSDPKEARSAILAALGQFRHVFGSALAFSMVINLLMLVPAIYMLQLYDRVLASMNVSTLIMLTLVVVGLYIVLAAMEMIRSKTLIRMGNRLDEQLNGQVFRATYESYLRQGNGNAQQSLSDFTNVRQFTTGQGIIAFFDAPWTPIFIMVMFMFHWKIGVLAIFGATILLILALANEWLTSKPLSEANRIANRANAQAASNLRNAEVIEAMGMIDRVRTRWLSMHHKMLDHQTVASERAAVLTGLTKTLSLAMQSLVLGLGAWLVIHNEMTAGMMIAGSILMGRALAPMQQLIGSWRGFVATRNAHERVSGLLRTFPERPEALPLPPPKGHLKVEGLYAAPPGVQKPVISNVSFALEAGQILGMVGPSASGKSTLARLLVGVWSPMAGKVRMDGADLYTWDKRQLGDHIGYLPQDIELFDGTVAENIARFGQIDPDQVVKAAQKAGVHEMILRFPGGYDTVIGTGGFNLSGGQRQRIALARAVYGSPRLIVLDEPNSNLDDSGEQALITTVRQLKADGVTVIIITHRTSIIAAVDQMLVMRDGQASMFGPRDDVLTALKSGGAMTPRSQP